MLYLVVEGDKLTYIQNCDLVASGVTPADLHQHSITAKGNPPVSQSLYQREGGAWQRVP